MFGRTAEQDRLASLLADVEIGAGAIVVRGPAGIGKTTLVEDALSHVGDRAVVVRTQAIPSEVVFPYGGLVEAITPFLGRLGQLADPQRGALERVLTLSSGSEASLLTVAIATLHLLGSRDTDGRATLLVLDDAHWLDTESANVLAYVARRAVGRLTMIIVVRHDDRWELMGVPTLEVGPLSGDAVDRLLREHASGLALHVRSAIRTAADGNPLALVQLPKVVRTADAPIGSEIPAGLISRDMATLFDGGVDRLQPEVRRALLIAAASGREHAPVVFAALTEAGVDREALHSAERDGLIRTDERNVRFSHPLLRAAVYARSSALERARAHLALASVTAGAEHAWHRAAATIDADAGVANALAAAGTTALTQRAYSAACDAFRRAAELTPPDGPAANRLVRAAEAALLAGRISLAAALAEEALQRTSDPSERIDALMTMAASLTQAPSATDHARLEAALLDAAKINPKQAGQALANMGLFATQVLEFGEAQRLIDLAESVSGSNYPATRAGLDAFRGHRTPGLQLLARGLPATEGAPVQLLVMLERFDELDRWIASTPDREWTIALRRSNLGIAEFERGRLPRAIDLLQEAHAETLASQPGTGRVTAAVLSRALAAAGRLDEARALLDRSFPASDPDAKRLTARLIGHAARGVIAVVASEWTDALRELSAAREIAQQTDVAEPGTHFSWAFDLVEVAVRLGDNENAQTAGSWLAVMAARTESSSLAAKSAAALALLADHCDDSLFEAAIDLDALDTRPLVAARIRLLWGERLHRERRRADARTQLRLARELFESMGASAWVDRADASLRATGEVSTRRSRDELSPQELAVAQKAATGMTVKQIAAELFLSGKTVEGHLSAVYRKLGVTGRIALAEVMRNRG